MGFFRAIFGSVGQKRSGGRSNTMYFELDGIEYEYRNITNAMLDRAQTIKWISGDPDKRNLKRLSRYQHKFTNWGTLRFLDNTIF